MGNNIRIIGIGNESGPFFFPTIVAYGKIQAVVNFIIDTGADISIMSYRDAMLMGIDFSKLGKKSPLVAIGGQTEVHFLRNVDIAFQTNDRKNPFYVMCLPEMGVISDPAKLYFPSILGIDVIRNFSLHFDLKQKLMYLELETEDLRRTAITTRTLLAKGDRENLAKRYSFMSYPNEFVRNLCLYLEDKLPAFFPRGRPQEERQVEDEVEKLLRARNYDYIRQGMSFEFAGKVYKPDIIFETEKTVLEIKLCKSPRQASKIVDEIGSDIVAYESKFKHLVFVVYDLGVIKNPSKFKNDIEERYSNTLVLMVRG